MGLGCVGVLPEDGLVNTAEVRFGRDELKALQPAENVANIREECIGFYREYLEGAKAKVRVPCEIEVGEGHPAEVILAAAERLQPAMIALSTHGRSGLSRAVIGSVADKVVRANTFPTLLVRRDEDDVPPASYAIAKILVPLDGSELSESPLAAAGAVAAQHNAEVTLLRVVAFATAQIYAPGYAGPIYAGGIEEIEESIQKDAEAYLQDAMKRVQGATAVRAFVLRGSPFQAISDFAKEQKVSLIVMSTHGRSGLRRFALGSVTDSVVREAGVPVLIIPAKHE